MSKREIFIIFILLIISVIRFFFFLPTKPDYDNMVGKNVSLTGVVVDDPDERVYNKRLIVRPKNQESNILVVVPKDIKILYGDEVSVSGVLETPENFITNTGKEFNYKRYLANKDIYFVINNANTNVISHKKGSFYKATLFNIKNFFIAKLDRVIPSPESDLAGGLILGTRGGFDNDLRQEFISTGTIHIVALSGYNITIVAESVIKILILFLSQTVASTLGIVVIILFIIMTGAQATAVRAGIMAVILLFARITGRTSSAGRGLVIAFVLMIVWDLRVATDISFQLSFLATFGMLFVTPKIFPLMRFLPMRLKIRETITTTIGATISVLPIILFSTGVLSLVSLPANVIILPLIPFAMFMSFLTAIFGFIHPILSLPFAFVSKLLLSFILFVIHFFASLPFASITIKHFPLVLVILLYILLVGWVFNFWKK